MKLILIRSPQLLFYKMKSKKGDKNMMMDTITISYNYNFIQLQSTCCSRDT